MSTEQTSNTPVKKSGGLFRRGPWEMGMTVLIASGILMLVQPFALSLYTYSFITILIGTLGFVVVSHFPE